MRESHIKGKKYRYDAKSGKMVEIKSVGEVAGPELDSELFLDVKESNGNPDAGESSEAAKG
jgi:hypothetical protein